MKPLIKGRVHLIGPTESVLTKRGNRFPNIADYLVSEGYEVLYYTSNFYHAEKRFFQKSEQVSVARTVPYKIAVYKTLGYKSNVSVRRVIANFFFSIKVFFVLLFKAKKFDKVLIPSRPVELIFFISLLRKLRNVSIYLDIQDVWPDALVIESKKKKRVFELYCNFFLRPALKNYNAALFVAPSFELWLRRYALYTPAFFLPLGWEEARWQAVETRKTDDKKTNQLNLVCVAQLQRQIDILPLLRAMCGQPHVSLTVIGEDGSGERYPEVQEFISSNGLENVKFIGQVARNEMPDHLINMDIGVLPMITASIPNKIFDYMAANLPIMVFGDNDSANFVKKHGIGWSSPFNSTAIEYLLENIDTADIASFKKSVINAKSKFARNSLHGRLEKILLEN